MIDKFSRTNNKRSERLQQRFELPLQLTDSRRHVLPREMFNRAIISLISLEYCSWRCLRKGESRSPSEHDVWSDKLCLSFKVRNLKRFFSFSQKLSTKKRKARSLFESRPNSKKGQFHHAKRHRPEPQVMLFGHSIIRIDWRQQLTVNK